MSARNALRRPAAAIAAAALATLVACGGGGSAALGVSTLDLPTAAAAGPLASTTVYTSPDGGIYRNPVHLDVLLVTRRDASALAAQLGGSAQDWSSLRRFGGFTVIAVRLRNDGKAASEPELRDLQVASDYAPKAAASGPLRHFYHPTYTLAAVADQALSGECRPRLDPGQATTVILVYPPATATSTLVWGRYQEFALRLPFGGGLGGLPPGARLHAALCPPPQPQPQ
jgi:hypothetical protein